jgi:hypothetical protein
LVIEPSSVIIFQIDVDRELLTPDS